ncbi:unnamed protein product [Linum tenue]|uniref:Uncharacterized protein n=1 Tax=Linum tenue TaxID=586396 RepID=A0AAV0KFG8_9ROSI|nr:unnamed protein product [Linum tenue]
MEKQFLNLLLPLLLLMKR